MAKTTRSQPEVISLLPENDSTPKPRLKKLIIKNYRCIGATSVEIELDDIVVLVGANNVGKSSILKAYELVMSQGSAKNDLTINDFPNGKIDPQNLPEIELHTVVYDDNRLSDKWIARQENGDLLIRERWIWEDVGKSRREGWNAQERVWSVNVPWGAPNIANAHRPEPHRVDAFDSPENQAKAIKDLLLKVLNDRVKNLKTANTEEPNDYHRLLDSVKSIQNAIVQEAKDEINRVNTELTTLISKVFPNYKIDFDAKPEDELDKSINLFKGTPELLMGPQDGYLSTIDRQGSGARRTLLWTALKYISENNRKEKEDDIHQRPHLLLLDEPEICLHPNAIREACDVLYNLPRTGNWQVMVTTHSPIFIDFSRNNTTIVKVERNERGDVAGTTVFRPERARLDENDQKNLKMLNICDPYVAEFFFGGNVIVVEGDTEYTAFNYIKDLNPQMFGNTHIIRARGKATIVSLIKILNHFGSSYAVLHDSDTPRITTKKGNEQANPAWGNNPNILNAFNARPGGVQARLLASLPNFEMAYFSEEAETEKPYNALKTISGSPAKFAVIEALFTALVDHGFQPPQNCVQWATIEELENLANQAQN